MGQEQELAVLDPVATVLRMLLSARSGDIASVLLISLEDPNAALVLMKTLLKRVTNKMMANKYVGKEKELVVLDRMMAVLLKLQSAQSMVTVNVQHTNLEILNVDLALEILHHLTWAERLKVMETKSAEKDKELVVQDLMMAVLQKLQSAQSMVTVNVPLTSLETQNVDLGLVIIR